MKSTLYIMCGLPGSGKSYSVSSGLLDIFFDNDDLTAYVSRDEIRKNLLGPEDSYFDKEDKVFNNFTTMIAGDLQTYDNVIADATHISRASRRKLISSIDKKFYGDYNIVFVYVDTPLEKCLEQNARRTGFARVPEEAIKSMARKFEYPWLNEDKRVKMVITFVFGEEGTEIKCDRKEK